jgi:hypothetical protein
MGAGNGLTASEPASPVKADERMRAHRLEISFNTIDRRSIDEIVKLWNNWG